MSSSMDKDETVALGQMRESFPADTTESYGMPLDDAGLLRYVRARNGSVPKATALLTATLDWRREFNVEKMLREEMDVIAKEGSTGKVYMSGYDLEGRPIMVMRPRNENTRDHDGNIKHLVYQMERARAILQKQSDGHGKMCLVIDYTGYSLKNAPPMKTSMATIRILQNHYPETLGVAYFVSPPLIFQGFYKVVYPFIDAVTRQKFVFIPGKAQAPAAQGILRKNFSLEELEEILLFRSSRVPDVEISASASGAVTSRMWSTYSRDGAKPFEPIKCLGVAAGYFYRNMKPPRCGVVKGSVPFRPTSVFEESKEAKFLDTKVWRWLKLGGKPLGGTYKTEFDPSVYLAAPMDQDFRAALAASSRAPDNGGTR